MSEIEVCEATPDDAQTILELATQIAIVAIQFVEDHSQMPQRFL